MSDISDNRLIYIEAYIVYTIQVMEVINMGTNCGAYGSCGPRNFLTKEEKVDVLKTHQKELEKEAKGVGERIVELEKE